MNELKEAVDRLAEAIREEFSSIRRTVATLVFLFPLAFATAFLLTECRDRAAQRMSQ